MASPSDPISRALAVRLESVKTLPRATQISYQTLKKHGSIIRLPLGKFQIHHLIRLRAVIKTEVEFDRIEASNRLLSMGDILFLIAEELFENGDATRTALIKTLHEEHAITLHKTTCYDHLNRLILNGWVEKYFVLDGNPGHPLVYFRFQGMGRNLTVGYTNKPVITDLLS